MLSLATISFFCYQRYTLYSLSTAQERLNVYNFCGNDSFMLITNTKYKFTSLQLTKLTNRFCRPTQCHSLSWIGLMVYPITLSWIGGAGNGFLVNLRFETLRARLVLVSRDERQRGIAYCYNAWVYSVKGT